MRGQWPNDLRQATNEYAPHPQTPPHAGPAHLDVNFSRICRAQHPEVCLEAGDDFDGKAAGERGALPLRGFYCVEPVWVAQQFGVRTQGSIVFLKFEQS